LSGLLLLGAGALVAGACRSRQEVAAPVLVTPDAAVPVVPAALPNPRPSDAGGLPDVGVAPDAAVVQPAVKPVPRPAPRVVESGGRGRGVIAKLKVTGAVERGDVERVLRVAVPKLQACRVASGATKDAVRGALELEITFGERGWVSLAEVKRSTVTGGDPQLCVVNELRALRFPKPSDSHDAGASFTLQFK